MNVPVFGGIGVETSMRIDVDGGRAHSFNDCEEPVICFDTRRLIGSYTSPY